MIGSAIIILTGIFDDMFELSAKIKFFGQIIAALVVVFWGEFKLNLLICHLLMEF